MSRIIVFGAGGRAGRRVVAEATARGHQVTAAGRRDGADVTDADSVAAAVAGHDAVVSVAYAAGTASADFFPAAARALVGGLTRAGVSRLVVAGIGTTLETAPGVAVHDAPGFPAEHREFSLGHTAELAVLRESTLDWLVVAPPPVVLGEGDGTGSYRTAVTTLVPAESFTYADFALALVDEATTPKHSRVLLAVA
ncbi:NAD(P)-dependent oxidoreductase [Amycolatopsis sp. NPDC049252]|uniref:NAD(P)-dependent oxidoreductase n=1 Tax=Amycolatopsis sp. NPDC049252 TaxID=3363933 RepID=UPI00371F39AD